MTRQTFLRARFFANFVVLEFLAPHIFIQRDPVIIELLAQPPHVFRHVMKLPIVLNAFR